MMEYTSPNAHTNTAARPIVETIAAVVSQHPSDSAPLMPSSNMESHHDKGNVPPKDLVVRGDIAYNELLRDAEHETRVHGHQMVILAGFVEQSPEAGIVLLDTTCHRLASLRELGGDGEMIAAIEGLLEVLSLSIPKDQRDAYVSMAMERYGNMLKST
ncbi:hypothetical protein CC80DRAFT_540570 [Byssothecium circinans]|uniref:Uncharacterized protein n=1 Tax=Byssothecium circinans TaxID=147558 RepID=A0A6A5TA44_9PLEO|nr:hypothetical protein CC80DRAFT_540570 [Byssothecium circinans]